MDLTLTRKAFRDDGIFGELTGKGGSLSLCTLEHAYPEEPFSDGSTSGKFKPKIPVGVYMCKRYNSPKHGYDVFILTGVGADGHYYEIHVGNYNDESDGCVLVGFQVGIKSNFGKMLMNSKKAFDLLMQAQAGIDSFTLTVEN